MGQFLTIQDIDSAADKVRSLTKYKPTIGMILGSGLGPLAEEVINPDTIPYSALPNWPVSTVEGHEGQIIIGELEGQHVLIMQGRTHFYEGYSMNTLSLPVRVMSRLGIKILVITNAAGAVNPDFNPGELMLLSDHLNLLGMAGHNPLMGPNIVEFGPRFPDMSQIYDRELRRIVRSVADKNEIILQEGVYVCLAGPSFESPADLRFLHGVGVDAVGMSTVPEAIVARHSGIRVVGISGISNKSNLDGETVTTHEEVLEAGHVLLPKLITVIRGLLSQL